MIQFSLKIKAPRTFVWQCMLHKTSMWWSKDFYTSPSTKKMVFDSHLGGRLYEDYGHKQGVIWADIIAIKAPEFVSLRGQLAPEFGGPNISFNKFAIEQTGDETCILHFSENWMVEKDQKFLDTMESGWKDILAGLKDYAERKGATPFKKI